MTNPAIYTDCCTLPVEMDMDLIDPFYALGVGIDDASAFVYLAGFFVGRRVTCKRSIRKPGCKSA